MPEDTVAGFRLVRKLGAGSRAEVYLGHAGGADQRTAAIKVFRAEVPIESIDAELRALGAAAHAHTVQLRDLSIGADGRPVLVLERLQLGSLAQLLAQRGQLGAGEVVTILAPLAAAVAALQESGVTHGAISAGRVLFRESGAPVLSGFGHASVGTASDVDRRALAALAAVVLERLSPADARSPQAGALQRWLGSLVAFPEDFAAQLGERVFALAAASPVRFAPDADADAVPPRTTVGAPVEEPVEVVPARWYEPYLARVPERFRRPKWIAVGAGALTLLVAIAAVPSGGSAKELTPTAAPSHAPEGAVYEDDPVAAFEDLVRARNDCIRELSILCLDTALQAGSAAMEDDTLLIRSIERGDTGGRLIEAGEVQLAERMGDAALVDFLDNGEPASVLLVKTEAGWRVRSYIAA